MNDELAFVMDDERWPQWPLLPVKKRNFSYDDPHGVGVVRPGIPKVYFTNLFDLGSGRINELLEDVEFQAYPDFEAMLVDWKVD